MIHEYFSKETQKRIDEIRQEGIGEHNEKEYHHLISNCEIVTTTNIKDGDYKIYHKANDLYSAKNKEEILIPFNRKIVGITYRSNLKLINQEYKISKYYANKRVQVREGKFDPKNILLAFDEIIIKSNDLTHIWIENLLLDTNYEIEIISGS
jgi:hypothetical protein